jgi:hypothetical protein
MAMSAAVLGLGVASGAACRDGNQSDERTRVPSADDLAREGRLTLGDSQVVKGLATPKAPGRIIYDPPEDLSLANAERMRPDLVKGDTTRRDTSHATRRDTTGGDGTVDTSGGAARRKRP